MSRVLIFLALTTLLNGQVAAEEGTTSWIITAAALIDGRDDRVISNPVVRVENGVITSITSAASGDSDNPATDSARRLDLPGMTLLPGFMDAHVHLTSDHDTKGYRALAVTRNRSVINGVVNAEKTLLSGFTTVRNVGAPAFTDLALRDAIRDGDIPGPRILGAGPALGVTGGHCDNNLLNEDYDVTRDSVADGPWEARKQVRRNIKYGADLIKFCATGGVFSKGTSVGAQQYTEEEMTAIVEEAHMRGKKVAAHAHGNAGIKAAIRAGADSIEHASFLDREAIRMAVDRGTFLSMDIYNTEYTLAMGEETGALPENIAKEREVSAAQRESFRQAVKAGARVVFGSDAAIYPHGDNGKQFARMVEFGMTPMQAIQAATSVTAELFGLTDIGTLAPGMQADIVAVPGNPLEDITALESVSFVMKGGTVHKAPLRDEPWRRTMTGQADAPSRSNSPSR